MHTGRVHRGIREAIINAKTEKDEAHGLIMARDFGGTKKWRTCYTSDGTSHSMLYAMDDKAHEQAIALESEVVTFGNMEAI